MLLNIAPTNLPVNSKLCDVTAHPNSQVYNNTSPRRPMVCQGSDCPQRVCALLCKCF